MLSLVVPLPVCGFTACKMGLSLIIVIIVKEAAEVAKPVSLSSEGIQPSLLSRFVIGCHPETTS